MTSTDYLTEQYREYAILCQCGNKGTFEEYCETHPLSNDPVNHPTHYTSHPSGIECIEITRHYNFAIGSAIKYLWRQGLKDSNPAVQDLKKAIWYIEDEIKRIEK